MPRWRPFFLWLALGSGCECRSDVDRANEVLQLAADLDRGAPSTVAPSIEACASAPGSHVATVGETPFAVRAHGDALYWAVGGEIRTISSGQPDSSIALPRDDEHDITAFDVGDGGVVAILQTRGGPARTRLAWRGRDGSSGRGLERDDVLLNDVVATPDGAYLLAGRVLGSPGPASELLFFSFADREARVIVDRVRGALSLVERDGVLFWLEHPHTGRGQSGRSALVALGPDGGEVRTLWEHEGSLASLAASDGDLYWVVSERLEDATGRLMRMPLGGGAAEIVRTGVRRFPILAEGEVVVAAIDETRTLHRIDVETGAASVVLESPVPVVHPTLAGRTLYFVTPTIGAIANAPAQCIRSIAVPDPS